ncbi:hypothetical protein [Segatella copri]|uniref:hypothetical protein n=1 Tax=Segatella copri TaxID=165179 RepID=UPI001885A374|nr:hypothetical protein [Segatella copri]
MGLERIILQTADRGICLCDREIYECLSGSFPTFYLVVSGKKRNFAAKLDVEL